MGSIVNSRCETGRQEDIDLIGGYSTVIEVGGDDRSTLKQDTTRVYVNKKKFANDLLPLNGYWVIQGLRTLEDQGRFITIFIIFPITLSRPFLEAMLF